MRTLCADVVDRPLVIGHRVFREPVRLLGRPVYGRVLFTTHNARLHHCLFVGEGPMLAVDNVGPVTIDHNVFVERGF